MQGRPAEHIVKRDHVDPDITFTTVGDNQAIAVELIVDGHSVSRCWIVPRLIRYGRAVLRMDGIGGVGTEPEYRLRGYARRVLHAAIRRMTAGDAGLSMLYGIADFYEQFGYVQAGPEYFVRIAGHSEVSPQNGWTWRAARKDDLLAIRRCYNEATRHTVGANVRTADWFVWRRLAESLGVRRRVHGRTAEAHTPGASPNAGECLVALSPAGEIRGYVWRALGFWAVDALQRDHPEACVYGEAVALDREAAEVLVVAVGQHAASSGAAREVLLCVPHDGPFGALPPACVRKVREERTSGGCMGRILDLPRLFADALPELEYRLEEAGGRLSRPITFWTEQGAIMLKLGRRRLKVLEVSDDALADGQSGVRLTSGRLLRMFLGVEPPTRRTGVGLNGGDDVLEILSVLFPPRCPHMYLADRF